MLSKIKKGFSLMELMIVIGIIGLVGTLVAPFLIINVQNSSIENDVKALVSAIREVQIRNKSRQNNKSYGIKLFSNKYNIFTGTSYATSEQNADVLFYTGNTISQFNLSNSATEITFSSNSIRPVNTGSFIMTNTIVNYQVNINSEGLITLNKV